MRFVASCLRGTEPGSEILVYLAGEGIKSD